MDYKKLRNAFYAGTLSPDQALQFLDWLETPEAEEVLSAEIIQMWQEKLTASHGKWDNRKLWEKINVEKAGYSRPYVQRGQDRTALPRRFRWVHYAAAILVIGIGMRVWFLGEKASEPISTTVEGEASGWITRTNPAGKKTRIQLSDGSLISLNSESSVSYPADFQANRKIVLEGEAFFEVAKDSLHPFTVETKGIITTALGTSFNISSFGREDRVAVTLVSGRVKLQQLGQGEFLELLPGEEAVLAMDEASLTKYRVDPVERILWTQGVLAFKDIYFTDLMRTLERWYGVRIRVKGTPNRDPATGKFASNESLSNVLLVLADTYDFAFQIVDKEVVIELK